MKIDLILGLQWGDEGKGKIVDVLTNNYDIIARFQGGPNAGHTLEFDEIKHVLHTIPSGIFHDKKINVIGNGVVIDPVIFKKEIDTLKNLGVDVSSKLFVSRKAHLIFPTHRLIENQYANKLYKQIKSNFKWMIYCDVDEFITTKKNIINTIKDELNTTFKDVDCIKIPWVMMSCNSIEKNPNSILLENTYRWNHNKKHPHKIRKFRCRYDEIEVKCIFKTDKFNSIFDHHPKEKSGPIFIVDSISKKKQQLNGFYKNLRENDIENGILLCYHYRIISKENSINKLKNNLWYIQDGYTINDLMSSDYPEIIDETLKYKIINEKPKFVHIN